MNMNFNYQEQQKTTLDLSNPIFAYYICTAGMSRVRAEEEINQRMELIRNSVDTYTNITIWVIPTDSHSKIECIYNGK